jgi:hypothetical protein
MIINYFICPPPAPASGGQRTHFSLFGIIVRSKKYRPVDLLNSFLRGSVCDWGLKFLKG